MLEPGGQVRYPRSGPLKPFWNATGELAIAEPKKLRYRLLHVAARLTHGGPRLRLRISATWPWRQTRKTLENPTMRRDSAMLRQRSHPAHATADEQRRLITPTETARLRNRGRRTFAGG